MPTNRFAFRLTQHEFASTAARPRQGETSIDIARKALVDQARLTDLLKEYGKTPDETNKIV
ncbi:hypothetical protein [Burkholderia cepacia]|uniref:hypothetical protein n=1 Tax=Burkholderia cepacia TaxID=292 RepID=UPI0012D944F4|nr:hypothetical protein [Burkholderia cepacia]